MPDVQARVLKGFRDYLPDTMLPRQRMLDRIAQTFESFGFAPLATPALEYADILLGKYGDEGDKLLYRFEDNGGRDVALRYDLTVPLARVVAMNGQLPRPFRRYQIAPVWRAEKPGRGRFREFVQCDVDIVGVPDLMADAECLAVGASVLRALGVLDFELRVNNRKLLTGMLARLGIDEGPPALGVLRTVDKLPKIGEAAVRGLLATENGLENKQIDGIFEFLGLDPSTLRDWFADSPIGRQGADELIELLKLADELGVGDKVRIDLSIARGLDYYTGTIYETFLTALEGLGSVMSGGRYDELLTLFGGPAVPAVGISLGVDRLLAGLLELGVVQATSTPSRVLVTVFDAASRPHSYRCAAALRAGGVAAEVFPGAPRMKKQLAHANRMGIPFAVIVGPDEAARGEVQLKDLRSGEQAAVSLAALIERTHR
ncbi:MAG: histidine--tRNA ligase [Myxococcales bacterium]|nr:histidine--tRNA ligase [Myxococcales bacterium]